MLWRAPEPEIFPLCEANGISQIVWSPLAPGLLTGKYQPGQAYPADARFSNDKMNVSMHLIANDETIAGAQRLRPIADAAGLTMPAMAIAWVLRRPEPHPPSPALPGPSRCAPTPPASAPSSPATSWTRSMSRSTALPSPLRRLPCSPRRVFGTADACPARPFR